MWRDFQDRHDHDYIYSDFIMHNLLLMVQKSNNFFFRKNNNPGVYLPA